jgi:prepilin-type N-terminal cleavage/methylation domain-containing protein
MRSRRSGFTLVELLVVIGIILVLMALLLPAVNKAWNTAVRTRMALDLQTVSTALEAYRADFQQYPQVYGSNLQPSSAANPGQGAYWLCRALVGPGGMDPTQGGDGAGNAIVVAGQTADPSPYGFRVVPKSAGGKIWGPYVAPDTLKMGDPNAAAGTIGNVNNFVLMDKYKHPILYYPGKRGTNITQPSSTLGGYLGPNGMFNPYDNTGTGSSDSTSGVMSAQMFMILMGDGGYDNGSGSPTVPNGMIDSGETPAYEGNYVLVSPGTDEVFGPTGTAGQPQQGPSWRGSPINPWDDVTNFPR